MKLSLEDPTLDAILSDPYRPDSIHAKKCTIAYLYGRHQRPIDDLKDAIRGLGYEWLSDLVEPFERGHKDAMEAL